MKKVKPVIFVDVDETCALHHVEWLRRYNRDWDDNLKKEDITDWGIHLFTKPECGRKIYEYLKDPSMYDNIVPVPGALDGVNILREMDYRVLFATSCAAEAAGRKFFWLRDWEFIKKERDYIEIRDKSLLRGRYMFDDSYENVNGFRGYGYMLTRPWNTKYLWYHRSDTWADFIKTMMVNHAKGL